MLWRVIFFLEGIRLAKWRKELWGTNNVALSLSGNCMISVAPLMVFWGNLESNPWYFYRQVNQNAAPGMAPHVFEWDQIKDNKSSAADVWLDRDIAL